MTAEDDFRALLVSRPAVAALVADRIAQNGVPEDTALPYIVFTVAHNPILNLGGDRMADQVTFNVESWAGSAAQADEIADAIEDAMPFAPGLSGATVTGRATGFDGDLGLDATVLTIDWWTD